MRVTDTPSFLIELVITSCPVNITHAYVIISSLNDHNMLGTKTKSKPSHLGQLIVETMQSRITKNFVLMFQK